MKKIKMVLAAAIVAGSMPLAATERPMTIDQLMTLVDQNSKSLKELRSEIEAANQGIEVARDAWFPEINTSLSVSYIGNALTTNRTFGHAEWNHTPHFGNSFSVDVQQVVYSGGAITAGVEMAKLHKEQAEVGVQLTQQQQRFIALGQYLDIYKIMNRIKVYESNVELTKMLLKQIKDKYDKGMALKNDITRYELQMEQLKLAITQLNNQRAILNHQLCNTLGISDSELIEPDENIINQTYAIDSQEAWQQLAASSSPVLQQCNLSTKVAETNEKLIKSEMRPKVALVAADELNGPITYEIPPINKNINIFYFGIGIKYNISSLIKSPTKLKQAQIATRVTREKRDVASENINNAVQQAYTQFQQSYVELATQQKSVELARQNYQVISDRYFGQLALVTDMVDASNLRLNAELQEVDARINIAYCYYKMKYISGNL